jgi:hypothetical protein
MHRRRFKVMSALQCDNHNPEGRAYGSALGSAFIVIGILLCGCSMGSDERNNPRTAAEGVTMAQTLKSTLSAPQMPPIDAVAYARIETATFALG